MWKGTIGSWRLAPAQGRNVWLGAPSGRCGWKCRLFGTGVEEQSVCQIVVGARLCVDFGVWSRPSERGGITGVWATLGVGDTT